MAAGGGTAWVANSGGDSVTRLRDRKTVPVGDNPRDLAVSGGSVWVANAGDDTLTRLDAASGEPVGDPTKVGDDPTGVAVGGGARVGDRLPGRHALAGPDRVSRAFGSIRARERS